jgi:hypothetical protein
MLPPAVPATGAHSLAQIWVYSKAASTLQTVEAGWMVSPVVFPDSAQHLFIYATNDDYAATGCYDNVPPTTAGKKCLTWVGAPSSPLAPGQKLSAGDSSSDLAIAITTVLDPGWTVAYSVGGGSLYKLGYYPKADFSSTMQTAGDTFEVGGEVYDPTGGWAVAMGTGATPSAGHGQAAYVHDYLVGTVDGTTATVAIDGSSRVSYAMSTSPAGITGLANYFYYGFAPKLFWHQDYEEDWSPAGDWASGEYKANCQIGQAVTGISRYTGARQSHGVACNEDTYVLQSNTCYARTFDPGDSRGDTDSGWDWDPGYFKGECAAGEYVQGVAQTTDGTMNDILCCPGALNHSHCGVQVFYSGNSSAYGVGPDWDFGYYKGHCPAGQYVAGVSAVANSSEGTVGAAHALLCCSP